MDDGRPLRNFPDSYSIKAVGKDEDGFAEHAMAVVKSIIEDKESVTHSVRASRNGAYLSVTLYFTAGSQEELDSVFTTMSAEDRVIWVL